MQIPKSFMLGKHRYTVRLQGQLPYGDWGKCYPDAKLILVATHAKTGKPRKETGPQGLGVSFWHETTHAILHDMDHPLWCNETFVTEFSRRLGQVVESAVL